MKFSEKLNCQTPKSSVSILKIVQGAGKGKDKKKSEIKKWEISQKTK